MRSPRVVATLLLLAAPAAAQTAPADPVLRIATPDFALELSAASQTVTALRPHGADGFDFTPSDRLAQRSGDGYYHLGDLTLRVRTPSGEWRDHSTATRRRPVRALPAGGDVLAAADLGPTLADDLPLEVHRSWALDDGRLALRFTLRNRTAAPVEVGALGMPLVFNNILTERSLDEAHAVASFSDPYIGADAGHVQVTRLHGGGPVLLVVPGNATTPFEAYRPVLEDSTRRGITFEGFWEWVAHSRAYAENEWADAEPWNAPTSVTLAPGESRTWSLRFLLAPALREIEATLLAHGRPVAVGVPGTVVPMDIEARLFLRHGAPVRRVTVEPAGALTFTAAGTTPQGWHTYDVRGRTWGRARVTVEYDDGIRQTIHYRVIDPAADVVAALGRFLTTEQWFERADDPFGRSPSVISYDYDRRAQVTEDNRAWIAGLGDEGGSGSWLAALMKQLVQPDAAELAKLQRFVDDVLWGGLQYADGDLRYAVRKSLFYWEPDSMPAGTYDDSVRYGGWSSWNRAHAASVGRSYNYPHVAAAHWVLYRLARNHEGLVSNHSWDWYLERAHQTALAMVRHAPQHARFGQMEGTVFLRILDELQREGWTEQAVALEAAMRVRAEAWRAQGYPYGSEMPWDSTGQEEVYAWCRYFGFDEKADVTLNAILAYMPTVPHWGYNGSARRYWDFMYAGRLRRLERQLHHYGSGLNAIPVLTEYRDHPDDTYLLRVGYGGTLGAIANITRDGFGPSGFHAYPQTLAIDGYSGDYGPGFFGYAVNAATYLTRDAELGWLAFGGNVHAEAGGVRVTPHDAARSRVYIAPLGLWLTLDAGRFESVLTGDDGTVRITLAPATPATPRARLRIETPGAAGTDSRPAQAYVQERGAWVVPLAGGPTEVVIRR